jgi:hypothetical protein
MNRGRLDLSTASQTVRFQFIYIQEPICAHKTASWKVRLPAGQPVRQPPTPVWPRRASHTEELATGWPAN